MTVHTPRPFLNLWHGNIHVLFKKKSSQKFAPAETNVCFTMFSRKCHACVFSQCHNSLNMLAPSLLPVKMSPITGGLLGRRNSPSPRCFFSIVAFLCCL